MNIWIKRMIVSGGSAGNGGVRYQIAGRWTVVLPIDHPVPIEDEVRSGRVALESGSDADSYSPAMEGEFQRRM